jgi:uncharacterized protein DUF4386
MNSVRVGGWALILGAIAFMGVFTYLAAQFDYPEILDGSADVVLPKLLATGAAGRVAWAFYAFLPLIWLPAGVGAYQALRRSHPGAMLLALQFAALAAISMMLGLMRWPSVHWHLAHLQATATPEQLPVISGLFDGLNTYLGNYIGEFLGELCFNMFFLLAGWALLRSRVVPGWVGMAGLGVAAAGFIGMFRNVTAVVAPVAAVNNYLLPLWMIVFGVVLLRLRLPEETG